jgi:DNA uptake protein ComE-like DNA-binding protein
MSTWSDKLASPYRKAGSILFVSLWTLVILLIFAVGIGGRVAQEITFAKVLKERLISLYLAKACVNQATLELEKDKTPEYDTLYELRNEREVKLEEGSFNFNIIDEESLINVNAVPQAMLQRLPGLNPDLAKSIFESGLKPFLLKEELLLVDGVSNEIFDGLKDLITVYGDGKVNINTASKDVLRVLGLEDALIEIILNYRNGDDQKEQTIDDREFKSSASILNDLREFTILTTAQELQMTELLSRNALCVNARTLKLNIETKFFSKPIRNYSVILDRPTGKIKFWQEQ